MINENPFKVGDFVTSSVRGGIEEVTFVVGDLIQIKGSSFTLNHKYYELLPGGRETNKPTNPKTAFGSDKLPLHLWPPIATALGSLALLDGALRYGRSNYRAAGARATIYADAAQRHMDAWMEGENLDPQSGVSHLGHALACLAILVDAEAAGVLTDDRRYPGKYRKAMDALTPHVARIKARHIGEEPKHYTIGDVV